MPVLGAVANTRPRHGSPAPGGSILITSAPKSDRIVAAAGPAIQLAQSMTFRPWNIPSVMGAPSCFDRWLPLHDIVEGGSNRRGNATGVCRASCVGDRLGKRHRACDRAQAGR